MKLPNLQQVNRKLRGVNRATKLRFLWVALMLVASTSAGFLGGELAGGNVNNIQDVQKEQVVLKTQGQLISSIANTVGASVVSVNVDGQNTDSLNELFGLEQTSTAEESAGTGIILTKSGLIMTNRHVVPEGTTSVSVTLSNGVTYNNVTIVGRTADTDPLDVAFLQINNLNNQQLTPALLGNSSTMQVGDSVIAIGNALGQFQNTVTSGIISGFGRTVEASDSNGGDTENLDDLFQTDAAINEGNSGGPLVNLDGQVIGMNTAVAGDAQNIGFAIPINDLIGTIKSVESTGKLNRPYLGTYYIPITPDVAQQYNLSVNQGAYIPPSSVIGQPSVISGGPAAKAGIEEGDIIIKINNQVVTAQNSLTSLIGEEQPGDQITVTVVRNGRTLVFNVTLGTAPTG
jgi:S1-C subfamily serine protease